MEKIKFKKFLPGIAWFLIILLLTCLPGRDLPKIRWFDKLYLDKWVHLGMFAGLTFLFSFPFFKAHLSSTKKFTYFLWIAIAASFWGLAIEFIQKYFVTGRSFDLLDWAADSIGALIAFWFCRFRIEKPASILNV
ncbi:MAG: VanZ family protein [Ginsengibacter sp.]